MLAYVKGLQNGAMRRLQIGVACRILNWDKKITN